MNLALGIDTSNYTTSLALYDAQAHEICQVKRLLPVKEGEKGKATRCFIMCSSFRN